MEKVLLTGAAGFIGSSIVRKLIKKRNYQIITPLLKVNKAWRLENHLKKIKVIKCDLTNYVAVGDLIKTYKPQYVVHLATRGVYPREWNDRLGILKGNYDMSVNLLEAIRRHHIKSNFLKHFINTGSVFEYGTKKGKVSEENVILNDNLNEYSASKKATTALTLTYKDNFPLTIIRPFTAYGPYGDKERFIEASILRALKNEPIRIVEGIIRDFIYVDDIAEVFTKSIGNKKVFGEIVNAGSGEGVTLEETAKHIIKITKSKSKIIIDNSYRRKKDSCCWADIEKAKRRLGWRPSVNIDNGISRTLDWVKGIYY
jgi:nucleoside-diphosphate-sugar epimerase